MWLLTYLLLYWKLVCGCIKTQYTNLFLNSKIDCEKAGNLAFGEINFYRSLEVLAEFLTFLPGDVRKIKQIRFGEGFFLSKYAFRNLANAFSEQILHICESRRESFNYFGLGRKTISNGFFVLFLAVECVLMHAFIS